MATKATSSLIVQSCKPERNPTRDHDRGREREKERLGAQNVSPTMTATMPSATLVPPRRTAPAPFDPEEEDPVEFEEVPLSFIAVAWKASKLFPLLPVSSAFAAKTMP